MPPLGPGTGSLGADVSTVVEKGKSAFIGPELYKKTLGIIGLGAIGSIVANTAISLGMDVYGYDPVFVRGYRFAVGPPRSCGKGYQRSL